MNICLDKDAYREKIILNKWFEENWSQISRIIENIKLDESGNVKIYEIKPYIDLDFKADCQFEDGSDFD